MPRPLAWSEVRGGIIALVVLLGVAVAVLKYSRVGALRGETFRVYALVGEARGVTPGSEVWLSGQKVGKITDIRFRSPAESDTSTRILIEMKLLGETRDVVRRDAFAQIRAGGTIIGAAVVYLTPGTPGAVALGEGDTLRMEPQSDVEGAGAQLSAAAKDVPIVISNLRVLVAQLQSTRSSVGALMNDGARAARVERFQAQAGRFMDRATSGRGTVGLVMQGGLSTRASRVMARADSVRALLASPNTSLGRFRKDSTLLAEVEQIRGELATVQALLDEPRGTAGRFLRDSAITMQVTEARRQMTLLIADMKAHPLHYISF